MKYHKPSVDALASVERTGFIDGKTVPVFFNMESSFEQFSSYYSLFIMEVYADGAVDCAWGPLVDLKLFLQKLQERWVITQIPDGENIVAGHLGELKVSKGKWLYDSKSFYEYVVSIVKELNPTNQDLFTFKGPTATYGYDRRAYRGIYREEKEDGYRPYRIEGKMMHAFYKSEVGVVNLVNLLIFRDSRVVISGLAEPITTDMDGLEKFVAQHKIISEFPPNTEVTIYGLGSFIAEQVESVPVNEILLEAYDIYSTLNNNSIHGQCELAYREYMSTPTIATRDKLREIYEKLPLYTIKDYYQREESSNGKRPFQTSIRMILYGDQEIEKWPYYIALKEQGLELPKIVVPKPVDE